MTQSDLRDKDQTVLHQIHEGNTDIQQITEATTLKNHYITYAFEKLEEQDLVHVKKPDSMVEHVIDGQKRVFQPPKQAKITEKGRGLEKEEENLDQYENLTHREPVKKVHQLEDQVKDPEEMFEAFRQQVVNQIH